MKRSLKVVLATLIVGSSLSLTACDDGGSSDEVNVTQAPDTSTPRSEEQAQQDAQNLVDNTVGNMP